MNRRQLLQLSLAAAPAILLSRVVRAADAELIVGSNVGAPPFVFKQGDTYSGFDVEVWSEIAKGMNRKWRLQPMEFGALIPALQTRNIDTPADLAGKHIGTETGTLAVGYIKDHVKDATVEQLPSINNALLALEAGRTDAVVYDKPQMLYYANNAGKNKVRVVQPALEGLDVGIGFQKGSPLVAAVNVQLAAMKADGRLQALGRKWFGEASS